MCLIPAGARVLGETQPVQTFGETRLAVSFNRLVMPDGRTYRLDQFMGLNDIGDAGLRDQVNQHYRSTFGASAAVGLISGFAQFLGTRASTGAAAIAPSSSRAASATPRRKSTAQMMNRFLNRPPTITIREGHRVKVYLTSDFELPAYDAGTYGGRDAARRSPIEGGSMKRTIVCGASCHRPGQPAQRQFAVIDPGNLAQAVLIAERTLREYEALLAQYQTLVRMAQGLGNMERYRIPTIDGADTTRHAGPYGRSWLQGLNSGDPSGPVSRSTRRLERPGTRCDSCRRAGATVRRTRVRDDRDHRRGRADGRPSGRARARVQRRLQQAIDALEGDVAQHGSPARTK